MVILYKRNTGITNADTLIVDGSKIGFAYQLLIVSLAYLRSAIPVTLVCVLHVCGHSTGATQVTLLTYLLSLLPSGIAVLLVGDSEFRPVEVLRKLDQKGWDFVLRQKTTAHVCLAQETEWHSIGSWVKQSRQSRWLGWGWLTESEIYPINLFVNWVKEEDEPW